MLYIFLSLHAAMCNVRNLCPMLCGVVEPFMEELNEIEALNDIRN